MTTIIQVVPSQCLKPLFLVVITGMLATGCTTYQQQSHALYQDWQHGDLTNAVAAATKKADATTNSVDAVIWRLEQATVLRANGQYEDSNKEFDQAEEEIDGYAQKAKISVSHETGALLSNQARLPYEGRAYDGIMLNTYKALNYLELGEPDKARPELIRAYQRQQDAVADNSRRIGKNQVESDQQKQTAQDNAQKAQSDPKFKGKIDNAYSEVNSLKPYADYVNPFTVYLDGLYFMANAADASDLERARKSFERISTLLSDNGFIDQDLAAVNDLIDNKPLTPATYIIFETGCAPVRDQIRIDIPTFWPELPYVGVAFPTLKFQNNYARSLTVTACGTNLTTILLSSMDNVVGQDFKNELPSVITKTLISSAIKAAATHFAWEATRKKQQDGTLDNGGIAGALVIIGGSVYQAAVNISDERTWTTLPKEFQFCRFPTPPDRKIDLSMMDGSQRMSLTIGDGTINLIYVKSINAATPLLATQIKLK